MFDLKILFKIVRAFFCLFLISFALSACTSSDEETTILDEELGSLEQEGGVDDLGELSDLSDEDLTDAVDPDDEFAMDEEFGEDSGDAEFDDADFGDEEFAESEFDDSEFDEFSDKSVAQTDSGLDEEFDEFAEFESKEASGNFEQSEQALAEELNGGGNEEYPVIENAQPTFPEEVIGQNAPAVGGQGPVTSISPLPVPEGPVITSETQEITMTEPLEPVLPQDDLGQADPLVPEDGDEPDVQTWVPVVKIKTDPFYRNQRLMNAVYIARPDENFEDISQKLFGEDKVKELKEDNPHLAKGIDPGDKVYYNSPLRPEDRSMLKFYYNDIGLQAQSYNTEEGDNMRRLGSKLLGFAEGWKEIWAINQNVDSKTVLPGGLSLRYWTGNESTANQPMAVLDTEEIGNEMPGEAMPIEGAGPQEVGAVGQIEEIPAGDLPPEPPLPEAQIAMPENNLEPESIPDIEPFPEEGIEPVPLPAPSTVNNTAQAPDNDSLLSIGALALLLMAGVGLVAIQIKKRKDGGAIPPSLEYTQV